MRSPRQVYDDHWDSIQAGDMDRVIADYAEDAAFVLPGKVARGHTAILATFEGLGEDLAGFALTQESVTVDGPTVLFEWSGRDAEGNQAHGVDVFHIHDNLIRQQALSYHKA
jgi:ketosteroid isomerase-like protein